MIAAYTGQPDMVRLLLRLGADTALISPHRFEMTARQLAEELGHEEVLAVFMEDATK